MSQNIQDLVCFYKINKCLGDIKNRNIVLGGDFNQNLDDVLDKSVYSYENTYSSLGSTSASGVGKNMEVIAQKKGSLFFF